MSWDEVSRINSDLMVPLDEKYMYAYGILPRKCQLKTISKQVSESTFSGEIISVNGNGIVNNIYLKTGFNWECYAWCKIDIDNGKQIIELGDTIERYDKIYETGISMDLSKVYSTINAWDKKVNVPIGKAAIINFPIAYEESLAVTAELFSKHSDSSAITRLAIEYVMM